MSDPNPPGPEQPGWPDAPPPADPPPASPPPAGPPPAGPPPAGPPPSAAPPPGYGYPTPGGATPPPGATPGAPLFHDPTAGYGSAGPWSEQQAFAPSGYQAWAPVARNEPMAGWSLGVSIFSLLCCGLSGPVGIVLAVLAMRKIDEQPQAYTGRGLAVAGLVVGIIATAFLVLRIALIATGSANSFVGF